MINTKKAVSQFKKLSKIAPLDMRLAAEWEKPWHILISTMLSSQTRDETTIKICNILFKKYSTPKKLAGADLKDIKKIIKPVNYYKTKARNIKKTGKIISKKGIPKDIDKLLELPGVGRKVANVYLAVALHQDRIGVDTHVTRISRKMGWTKHSTNNKGQIEKDLERLFPKKYWRGINYILVRFGRKFRRKEDDILNKLK
jgi:endonuclease-3